MGARSSQSRGPGLNKSDGHLLEYFRQNFGAGGGGTEFVPPPPSGMTASGGVTLVPPPPGLKVFLKYSKRCPSVLLSPGPLLCDDLAPMSNHLKCQYRQELGS